MARHANLPRVTYTNIAADFGPLHDMLDSAIRFCGWKGSGITGKGGLGTYYVPQFMREQSQTLWR